MTRKRYFRKDISEIMLLYNYFIRFFEWLSVATPGAENPKIGFTKNSIYDPEQIRPITSSGYFFWKRYGITQQFLDPFQSPTNDDFPFQKIIHLFLKKICDGFFASVWTAAAVYYTIGSGLMLMMHVFSPSRNFCRE